LFSKPSKKLNHSDKMKLASTKKLNSSHSEFTFAHRIKGVKIGLEIVAFNEKRAQEKAWALVKQIYKDLKEAKGDHIRLPDGAFNDDKEGAI
jgi:hypothetical protein